MDRPPTAVEVRELLRPLDELDRRVLGGLVAMLIAEPARCRDREGLAQCFVQLAVVASSDDADPAQATSEDVERIRRYAEARHRPVVNAALALFLRIAEDLRVSKSKPTPDAAKAILVAYLAGD